MAVKSDQPTQERDRHGHLRQHRQLFDEHRVDLPARANATRQCTPVGPGEGFLTCRIDLAEDQHVGTREHLDKVVEQVVCP